MKKHNILTMILIAFLFMLIPAGHAQAKSPVKFETDSVTFASRQDGENIWLWNGDSKSSDYENIVEAESSNEKVAWVKYEPFALIINPSGVGNCDITATDEQGNKATVHVTVKASYIADVLKNASGLYRTWYGTKKIDVWSLPGATGKLKIGKKTYKFSIPKSSSGVPKSKLVKIGKVYKLNTKVVCTISINSNGTKVTTTLKDKLSAYNYVMEAKGKKKTLTLKIFNLHKGDVVKVRYKGKTYSKKIRKDKDNRTSGINFKLKKKLTKKASFTVTIINKDKKKLVSEKLKLTNWRYTVPDDEDYIEDESVSEW